MFAALVPSAPFALAEKERGNSLSRASTAESLSAILNEASGYASECNSSPSEDQFAAALDSGKSTPLVDQPTPAAPLDNVMVVVGSEHEPCKTRVSTPKAVSIFGTVERPVCLRRLPSVQSSEKRMGEIRKPSTGLFERAAAARLEQRTRQDALAEKQAIKGQVIAEDCSGPRVTPVAGQAARDGCDAMSQAAARPQPAVVERSERSKFAHIHGLPSVRSPVSPKDEQTCEPLKVTVVVKRSVSKFARNHGLPSSGSPAAPNDEDNIERRKPKVMEKASVKLPRIHGLPPARSSSKVGKGDAKKDRSVACPKTAAMWQRISNFARLPGLTSTRTR